MSKYTRYLLNSAGINATGQDIAAIDATGHPDALVQALRSFQYNALTAQKAQETMMQAILKRHKKPFKLRRKDK